MPQSAWGQGPGPKPWGPWPGLGMSMGIWGIWGISRMGICGIWGIGRYMGIGGA
jgi:hypothetical protein